MPSWVPNTPTERIMWLVLLFLVFGYLGGQWLNRQRTKRVGGWLQAGLGSLGGNAKWRWSKTLAAGAEVTVEEARAPFRNWVISYYLLTREFPPLWLWERIKGKHDLVSARANLRLAPQGEFEIVPRGGALWAKLNGATAESAQPYQWQDLGNGLSLGARGGVDAKLVERAKTFMRDYGAYVERISLRQRNPHVMAFFRLTGIERTKSESLWRALGDLTR